MKKNIRLVEVNSSSIGKYWYIEKRHWLGFWYKPNIQQVDSSFFFNLELALKWFTILSLPYDKNRKIILEK